MNRLYHGFQLGDGLFCWENLEFLGERISYKFCFPLSECQIEALKQTSSDEEVEAIVQFEQVYKAYQTWKYETAKDAAYRILSSVNHELTPYLY
jgi:hypothetical protein